MRDTTVAKRYAQALFIVTEKRGETTGALGDLKSLADFLGHGGRVAGFLANPQVQPSDKRDALRRAFDGKVARSVLVFVDLLLRKKRLNQLVAIANAFEAIVEKAQGVQRAHVVSAVALSNDETQRLHKSLEQYTRSKIKLTSETDSELLGGALVRIGDRVIDRSVRTLLDSIRRQLEEVSV